jgi:hypothetical protein|tara:strand:- start:13 stop:543 length:531 start_codon:yes stop_codon:yes gene_type:complete
MDIKSLTLKNKLVDDYDGESYWDLSAVSFKYDAVLGVKAIHYVTQDQVGRPDLISILYFGTAENVDAICVINNIFNPFSLQEGDVLAIPILSSPDKVYSRPKPITRVSSTIKPYIDTAVQSKADQNRIDRLIQKAKTKKNGVQTPLPPNVLQQGQKAKVFEDKMIKLGQNLNTRKG